MTRGGVLGYSVFQLNISNSMVVVGFWCFVWSGLFWVLSYGVLILMLSFFVLTNFLSSIISLPLRNNFVGTSAHSQYYMFSSSFE